MQTMSKSGKLMPNLDEKTTKSLNLTVLQRCDSAVEEILMTVAHVAMYELNVDAKQWSRKHVEGSLFVVKRNGQPRFQFIVMNRLSTANMVENLLGDFEYEVHVPYLLYQNASQEIYGIWFYNPKECEELGNLFGRILNQYPKGSTKTMISPMKSKVRNLETVPTQAAAGAPATSNPSEAAVKGASTPKTAISGQPHHPRVTVGPVYPQIIPTTTSPSAQIPASLPTSTPILPILEKPETTHGVKHSTDLVTPSSFISPTSSSQLNKPAMAASVSTALPLNNPQGNTQQPYGGASSLHLFPPPIPQQPLAVSSAPTPTFPPVISREKVREALQMLVQDTQFIDVVYQAMVKAHLHS
ncbi:mRNA-decapping enzyme-like protein isoform X2 [Andrographis paniculata]|uniref:mRNA-decapping enzyme-like protein isoform X2 n=1 Tax=Andrographis paniculata TaxID=175694 RepID=UPI0021E81DF0|nr:mRNA-decapping enzyme-like protein isoform X2 [Andrographis paniculata]